MKIIIDKQRNKVFLNFEINKQFTFLCENILCMHLLQNII